MACQGSWHVKKHVFAPLINDSDPTAAMVCKACCISLLVALMQGLCGCQGVWAPGIPPGAI